VKNLIQSLEYLAPFTHRVSHRAAASLLAKEYIRENPISEPDTADAEMRELDAQFAQ
jgi:hypothetical protein